MKNYKFNYSFLYSKLKNLKKIKCKVYSFFVRNILILFRVKLGKNIKFYGWPNILRYPGSRIEVGDDCIFSSSFRSNPLGNKNPCNLRTISNNAFIFIGNNVGISGTSIVCSGQIFIDSNTLIGANTIIVDNDFHQKDHLLRKKRSSVGILTKKVKIGSNCWIGANCTILKGVELGSNVIVGFGSVVTKSFPANSIIGGNPAKLINKNSE